MTDKKITPEAAFVERLPETMRHAARVAVGHGAKLHNGELVLARDGAEVRFGMTAPEPAGERETLECPCCGDVAAESDAKGMFVEGQPTICGCSGIAVAIDDGGDEPAEMYIDWDDWDGSGPCAKCDAVPEAVPADPAAVPESEATK